MKHISVHIHKMHILAYMAKYIVISFLYLSLYSLLID